MFMSWNWFVVFFLLVLQPTCPHCYFVCSTPLNSHWSVFFDFFFSSDRLSFPSSTASLWAALRLDNYFWDPLNPQWSVEDVYFSIQIVYVILKDSQQKYPVMYLNVVLSNVVQVMKHALSLQTRWNLTRQIFVCYTEPSGKRPSV